jgi:hypothetical protein
MATVWTEPRLYRTNYTSTPRALSRKEKNDLSNLHRIDFIVAAPLAASACRGWLRLHPFDLGFSYGTNAAASDSPRAAFANAASSDRTNRKRDATGI